MKRLVALLRSRSQAAVSSKQASQTTLRVLDSAERKLVSGGEGEIKTSLPKTKW